MTALTDGQVATFLYAQALMSAVVDELVNNGIPASVANINIQSGVLSIEIQAAMQPNFDPSKLQQP